MGSGSQHHGDPAKAFTEEWGNETTHASATVGTYWLRESPPRDWSQMVHELRWMWEIHVYVIASLFMVLAVFCLLTVLTLRAQLSQSRNLISLNVFLGILACARLLVLFLDPYGSKLVMPAVLLQVLWDLGYPCLVSAFSLLQLAVVREEAEEVRMARLSENAATIVITLHFSFIITSGVLGAVRKWLRIVWLVTQVVFIVWGGFLFLWTLFGCLRVLRTTVKGPLKFLTQVDPGCEVNNIVPLGMFTEQQQHRPHQKPKHQHQPRIHITDVDDQTYSYASERSLALHPEQRSEYLSMRGLPAMSPTRAHSPDRRFKPSSSNEDPAAVKPLIDRPRQTTPTENVGNHVGPATIFSPELRSPKQSLTPSLMPSIFSEDIKSETLKLKRSSRSRIEKNLRHLVFTSCLGIALCLLRAYDVFGLDGLMSSGKTGPILPWFFFQTASRFVELMMACAMVYGSQQSFNRHYYYRN